MNEQLNMLGENPEPITTPTLGDAEARERINSCLDATLFVEAGAGTGKTTALVERVVRLVASGVPISKMAIITFTEKAAAELQDRISEKLAKEVAAGLGSVLKERYSDAIQELDGAAISTLHAFAQRLLSEHPLEAGLPPHIDVLDPVSADLEFEERWGGFIDELIDDESAERLLLVGFELAPKLLGKLREIAVKFSDNWDLLEDNSANEQTLSLSGAPLLAAIDELSNASEICTDDGDPLLARIAELDDWAKTFSSDLTLEEAVYRLNNRRSRSGNRLGRAPNWQGQITDVRELHATVETLASDALQGLIDDVFENLSSRLSRFVLEAAEDRRRVGRLTFHDLLVFARRLLRSQPEARAELQGRYQCLLLDEFQDTDPIQIEIALLLGSLDEPAKWQNMAPEPGRLFFVGDPKQSIYRFRRADIAMFLEASSSVETSNRLNLTTNFRSSGEILDWVNGVFSTLITSDMVGQPEYVALEGSRKLSPKAGPPVLLLGKDLHHGVSADELKWLEAEDVVRAIETILAEKWLVDDQGERPAKLDDIVILLPTRTSLSVLEAALANANIPFRSEADGAVYNTQEVRDLMAALRAIDDPTDELSAVTALRSPLYGCGDDDLYRFSRKSRASFSHQEIPDLTSDSPVLLGMTHLSEMHALRYELSPSQLIARVLLDRRGYESAFAQNHNRDIWRRYRFVVDQARAFAETEGGDLRRFLAWVQIQNTDQAKTSESVLPETDQNAVRIMTIHASKGLEFPITILSGTSGKTKRHMSEPVLFLEDGSTALNLGRNLRNSSYGDADESSREHETSERMRLLYVGATRAKDHLVVSVHRSEKGESIAKTLWDASRDSAAIETPLDRHPITTQVTSALVEKLDEDQWKAQHNAIVERSKMAVTVSATGVAKLADENSEEEVDLGETRGALGTAIGRAVHGVLEDIDLTDSTQLSPLAEQHSTIEKIDEEAKLVESLARSAFESPVLREAASAATSWREVFLATELQGQIFEGYIDLLIRDEKGLIVVDYKTDIIDENADLKLARYTPQIASYGLALEKITSETVHRLVFVFCDESGAHQVEVADPRTAMDKVSRLLVKSTKRTAKESKT